MSVWGPCTLAVFPGHPESLSTVFVKCGSGVGEDRTGSIFRGVHLTHMGVP